MKKPKKNLLPVLLQKLYFTTKHIDADSNIFHERVLYLLLRSFESVLPPLDDYFHKAFRQTDVVTFCDEKFKNANGNIDCAIWTLLHRSTLFWEIFEELSRSSAYYQYNVTLCPNNQPFVDLGVYYAKNRREAITLAAEENWLDVKRDILVAQKVK